MKDAAIRKLAARFLPGTSVLFARKDGQREVFVTTTPAELAEALTSAGYAIEPSELEQAS